MANTLQIKRRIQTAQNVSKTTKAMQMIAASKLKRAQDAAVSARPYVQKITVLSQNLIAKVGDTTMHPYMTTHGETNKTLLLVLAPDKGLCGGLITNLLKMLIDFNKENDTQYITLGKKIENNVALLDKDIVAAFPFGTSLPSFDMVFPLVKFIDEHFLMGKVNSVKILSTNFQSIFTQVPNVATVLPIAVPVEQTQTQTFSLFEPSVDKLLTPLLKQYLEMTLYQHLLESYVSEQAARMLSMQNATNNANDMIEDLKLLYNKLRQEKITSEILDIGGAQVSN